jgi:hypothetical protein
MIKTRYKIGEQYLLHDKWLVTAVKSRLQANELEVTGFIFDDIEVHNNIKVHGFNKSKDDLYYFSNDATMVESIQTIRNNKTKQVLR